MRKKSKSIDKTDNAFKLLDTEGGGGGGGLGGDWCLLGLSWYILLFFHIC